MKQVQIQFVAPGRYKLAKDWEAEESHSGTDEFKKAALKIVQKPNKTGHIIDYIVFPAGITVSVGRPNNWGMSLSIYKKYNKGIGIPSYTCGIPWHECSEFVFPVLEIP